MGVKLKIIPVEATISILETKRLEDAFIKNYELMVHTDELYHDVAVVLLKDTYPYKKEYESGFAFKFIFGNKIEQRNIFLHGMNLNGISPNKEMAELLHWGEKEGIFNEEIFFDFFENLEEDIKKEITEKLCSTKELIFSCIIEIKELLDLSIENKWSVLYGFES